MLRSRIAGVVCALVVCGLLADDGRACTSGAANGEVTVDGRPLIWKSRADTYGTNDVRYFAPGLDHDGDGLADPYGYLGMGKAWQTIRMGLNSQGVATVANTQYGAEYPGQPHPIVLGNCTTLDGVRDVYAGGSLDEWRHLFFATDAQGGAVLWEANRLGDYDPCHFEYDVTAFARDAQYYNGVCLSGWITRASWGFLNEDGSDNIPPADNGRYRASMDILTGVIADGGLSGKSVYREFLRDPRITPQVVSSMLVHGVLPGEDPALSTLWAQLGHARTSIAVPIWVAGVEIAAGGQVPAHLGYDADNRRESIAYLADRMLLNGYNLATVEARTLPFESHLFDAVTDELLPCWRERGDRDTIAGEMDRVTRTMSEDVHRFLDFLETHGADSSAAPRVSALSYAAEGLTVSLDYEAFDDDDLDGLPDAETVTLSFDYGGAGTLTGDGFTYDEPGRYLVSVTGADAEGLTQTDWLFVDVSEPQFLAGDANCDGCITDGDYTIWADHYGATGATFEQGDFNGDGVVSDGDYTVWADNYGNGTVPEPACLLVLGVSLPALRRRRRAGDRRE